MLEEDFAELLLDLGGTTEELEATLEDDTTLELDETELLEGGSFSKVAKNSKSSFATM